MLKQLLQMIWQETRRSLARRINREGVDGSGARGPAYHRELASTFFSQGRWREAADSCRRALGREPGEPQDWNTLGLALKELGELAQALLCFERGMQIAPDAVGLLCNAASARRDLGDVEESLAMFKRARELAPDNLDTLSAYLFTLNLATRPSRQDIFQEHLECERLLGALQRTAQQPGTRALASQEKLRIGYLSPDLRYHAVSLFVEPLLAHHDRERFEIHCYYLHPRHDSASHRLRQLSDHWTDCAAMSDVAIAQRIASDRVDILVDLAGHTDWNRIPVLAHRPAPVQATWLGYLNTTGLRAVDYRITDRHADPPGTTEGFHTEALIRLPESQWCRHRPAHAIAVSPLPASLTGAVRFGSFNKPSKLSRQVLRLWAEVLARLSGSTLLFAGVEEWRRDHIVAVLGACGVDAARLEFTGRLLLEQFLVLHHRVDIALDAYPYSGATTTLDSLWMGVPVLTLIGDAPISRSTASILATLQMREWIAQSEAEFVAIAMRHARDLAALASVRANLRNTLESSILMDGARFTRQLETLYLEMWQERGRAKN